MKARPVLLAFALLIGANLSHLIFHNPILTSILLLASLPPISWAGIKLGEWFAEQERKRAAKGPRLTVKYKDIQGGDLLIGDSTHLCEIYDVDGIAFGHISLSTEFGYLMMDPEDECMVIRN